MIDTYSFYTFAIDFEGILTKGSTKTKPKRHTMLSSAAYYCVVDFATVQSCQDDTNEKIYWDNSSKINAFRYLKECFILNQVNFKFLPHNVAALNLRTLLLLFGRASSLELLN